MAYVHTVPLVIYILAGGLLGLISWGFIRVRSRKGSNLWGETPDDPLVWLLVLAAFTMGVFITYVLFGLPR